MITQRYYCAQGAVDSFDTSRNVQLPTSVKHSRQIKLVDICFEGFFCDRGYDNVMVITQKAAKRNKRNISG